MGTSTRAPVCAHRSYGSHRMRAVSLKFAHVALVSPTRPSTRRGHRGCRVSSATTSVVISAPSTPRTAFHRTQNPRSARQPQITNTRTNQRDVRVFAENDGRGPNPNEVDGPVKFGGEMVGVGIFLLIAIQFFVLAFVDFPFQAR